MRTQHPSGRPVRQVVKPRSRVTWWNLPLEQAATPRLRRSVQPQLADAIGYKVQPVIDDYTWPGGRIGFLP